MTYALLLFSHNQLLLPHHFTVGEFRYWLKWRDVQFPGAVHLYPVVANRRRPALDVLREYRKTTAVVSLESAALWDASWES